MDAEWVWSNVRGKPSANNRGTWDGQEASLDWSYVNVEPTIMLELHSSSPPSSTYYTNS